MYFDNKEVLFQWVSFQYDPLKEHLVRNIKSHNNSYFKAPFILWLRSYVYKLLHNQIINIRNKTYKFKGSHFSRDLESFNNVFLHAEK